MGITSMGIAGSFAATVDEYLLSPLPPTLSHVLRYTHLHGMRLRVLAAQVDRAPIEAHRVDLQAQPFGRIASAGSKLGPAWWTWSENDGVEKPSWWLDPDDTVVC